MQRCNDVTLHILLHAGDCMGTGTDKNERPCCRVMEYAEWLPGKTFRTSRDNLKEDFTNALKDLRTRREFGIEE